MTSNFLTKEGFQKLQEELDYLQTTKRQEVAARLHEAMEGGELIENAEYEAAKNEFAKAMKADPNNPFAFNNNAVLLEREGKLNDALALLNRASTHANEYFDKVTQTCFAVGGCLAVKPLREVGEKSSIAPIIQENIAKLQAKIAATGTAPPPGSPPPMVPPAKTK